MIKNNIRAILIADDHYNGLGVVRSLGERKVPVYLVLLNTGKTIIDKSRYVVETIKVHDDNQEIMNAVDFFIEESSHNVLFPLSDYAAELLDENRCKFGNAVIVPHANGKLREYQNKFLLADVFEQMGINIPKHICVDTNDSYEFIWEEFPAIIKPVISVEGVKSDIICVDNHQALKDAICNFREKGYGRVLVEKYVTGEDEHMVEVLGYTDKEGEPHFSKVVSKIREYPFCNGSTSYAQLCTEHQGLDYELLSNTIKKLGYYGLFDIEFKYADGRLYFIEMNFRNGAPAYALTRTGFNIVYAWLCDAINQTKAEYVRTEKEFFMCEHRDILNVFKKRIDIISWVKQFWKSQKVICDIRDFKPTILIYKDLLQIAIRRLGK